MQRGYRYQQKQSSYAMRQESQQHSSYTMSQKAWHSSSDHQRHVSGMQVSPTVCVIDSQRLKNQARLDGGFSATHQDGWNSQNMYQNGGMHQSGWGHGSGSGVLKSFAVFERAMLNNAMGNADLETFEEMHVPPSGTMRRQEMSYERSSWSGGNDVDLNYQHCFDNRGANWNRNSGYQRFEWVSKGI
ncbi:hypothetical protein TorRG33x02_053020 [Trema orientale]|uniref:Uncharacterized protein n=1 Tax=Trema orientale TaxID=63057 RepID=A0A2P5FMP4_TREOI|nr:hypothetical protein TorRG33x02_053020 [Trema orientale]